MPFKTKRQKIAAAQRRYTFSEGTVSIVDFGKNSNDKKIVFSGVDKSNNTSKEIDIDGKALSREVLKIVVISVIIICLQVGLRLTLF